MPFLAPIVPALIAGGVTAGGSMLASKLSKVKPTALENQVTGTNLEAQRMGMDMSKSIQPQAQNLIGMGTQGFQAPMNYWTSILSGNRAAATATLAPEISRISEGYRTANKTSAALNPRGGPSASFMSELPFAQQRDVSSLLQGARPMAAGKLFESARDTTAAGSGLFSNAVNALYGTTAAGRDVLSSEAERRRIEGERGKSIGAGLFDLIQKYGMPIINKIGQPKPDFSGPGVD